MIRRSARGTAPRKPKNPFFSRRTFLGATGAGAMIAPFVPLLESEAAPSGYPTRLILLFSANVGWLFVATGVGYFLAYEWLHFCYHLDPGSWEKLETTGAALYDRKSRPAQNPRVPGESVYGPLETGLHTELSGRELTLVGGFDLVLHLPW